MESPENGGHPLTRRRLLKTTAAAGIGGALAGAVPASAARTRALPTGPRVAVFGAGVAGLSAAHELAERGFRVTVYERKALGGKARSIPVTGTGRGGRKDLPAEHGFRAEFSFYRNLPDIMKRIPFGTNANGVYDNLRGVGHARLARMNAADATIPIAIEGFVRYDAAKLWETIYSALRTVRGVPIDQLIFFARQVAMYFSSGDLRRFGQWEYVNWFDFTRAGKSSREYRLQFADGLTRNLAAARPEQMSVNSTGIVGESFAYSLLYRPTGPSDRALNAPTNESWIDPWIRYLQSLGVDFQVGHQLTKLTMGGGKITEATVQGPDGSSHQVLADHYVSAVPVERAMAVFDEAIYNASPELRNLSKLVTDWMNGVIFHLDREVPICDGHISYVDSQSALTSISQAQIWRKTRNLSRDYGDGRAKESFSAIISDWKAPGMIYKKPLWSLPREQVIEEVWEQMKAHLNDRGKDVISDDMVVSKWLDPAITYPAARAGMDRIAENDEPLLINTPGSWDDRPEARTGIPNLILAGDYVRNTMNCATMESACETGRRAANAVCENAGVTGVPVLNRWIPPENGGLRRIDDQRYRDGRKHILDFPWTLRIGALLRSGEISLQDLVEKQELAARW